MGNRNCAVEPGYLSLFERGELEERCQELKDRLRSCSLCPHRCEVNRLENRLGKCRTGRLAIVASASPHFGEERPLVGRGGSGTIFFSHCPLSCEFCQNYDISQLGEGREVNAEELARVMLKLQYQGCHNINFVTPTHVVPQILEALLVAIPLGLRLPLVYNSGGYDSVDTLWFLKGVFDIYLPDLKYGEDSVALKLSGAPFYTHHAFAAVKEMHRQAGDLQVDERGVAYRGVLVRHLVLPNGLARSERVMDFLASLSREIWVNVMEQYHPCYQARSAGRDPELAGLGRRPTREEVGEVLSYARSLGMKNAAMF